MKKNKKVAKKTKKINFVNLFAKRIDAGVKFLDKKLGRKSWVKKVSDLENFDMVSNHRCVLAQVFRNKQNMQGIADFVYGDSVFSGGGKLGLTIDQVVNYGFCATGANGDAILMKLLNSMWYVKLYQLKNK